MTLRLDDAPARGGAAPSHDAARPATDDAPVPAMRHFDFATLPAPDRYRLLTAAVLPRPIAWAVTRSAEGRVNAAPYSFFNVFGSDRPVVCLGVLARPERPKDTAVNIRATREFVINLVPFALTEAMNLTCVEAPPEVDETRLAGLATLPSVAVRPPRIAASPVAFECRLIHEFESGPGQWLFVGEVLHAHVATRVLTGNPERPRIDHEALDLVARMHGPSAYLRTRDVFDLVRPVWADTAPQSTETHCKERQA